MNKFRTKETRQLYQHASDLGLSVDLTSNGHLKVTNPKTKTSVICSSKNTTSHVLKRQLNELKMLSEGRLPYEQRG